LILKSHSQSGCVASSVKLRLADPLQVEHWDELLRTHPESTIFHSQGWARVLATTYKYTPLYLVAADSHRLWALLPLCEVRSWLTGRRGVSLPFTDRCSPLLSPSFDLKTLLDAALDIGRTRNWKSLEIRGVSEDVAPASVSFYQHDLDLALSETNLFEGCDSGMRRSIRKAQRSPLEIELHTSLESVETYYGLHQLTRRKHGLPPQPLSFFRNLHQFVIGRGHGKVLLARLGGTAVAGAIFLHFGGHSVYKFGASNEDAQDLRPNNLLLWRGLLEMKSLGANTLSFGRTSLDQDGLRRFKRAFGATEMPLDYVKYDYRSSTFALHEADHSSGAHTQFFRLCPKPLSRLIGTLLYPHVG
jgi:CelD/BcsL family acetyltransferase involved in cellulose biosynthesis